jgi:cytochrome c oxidase accessory protein FixG
MPDFESKTPSPLGFWSLFAGQKHIDPLAVNGIFRKRKWIVMAVLLGIYYLAPWIRYDRGPDLPNQALLIDMQHWRGYFFGIQIWPEEVYYLTGLLILAAVSLFFVTSLIGRAWCGYACPQTVWTDLFIKVEEWIQGDRNKRIKRRQYPFRFDTLWRIALTHLLWIIIALFTGGAWVLYFNDAPTLIDQLWHLDLPWSVGGWIIGLTGSTYLMAGYAREQVCTYMCPYARFQSAMFDSNTLIIRYDTQRGEPRSALHKTNTTQTKNIENKGDCIDCHRCVFACPMGIDIRDGLQMECIACGLCIDACDPVMEKIGKPTGLISYSTENGSRPSLWQPRSWWYVTILIAVSFFMIYQLTHRELVMLQVQQDRNPQFVILADGSIRNGYRLSVSNKSQHHQSYQLKMEGLDGAIFMQPNRLQHHPGDSNQTLFFDIPANSIAHIRFFVRYQPNQSRHIILAPRHTIHFIVTPVTQLNHNEYLPAKPPQETLNHYRINSLFASKP